MVDVEHCLDSLPCSVTVIDVTNKGLTSLPSLKRFTRLKHLFCSYNVLTSLPELPEGLTILICTNNQLTRLPTLPKNLQFLLCSSNKLTRLPDLPERLKELRCCKNQLITLPILPEHLENLLYENNPVHDIIKSDIFSEIRIRSHILKRFQFRFHCLKWKHAFCKWLWERVRQPKIAKMFDPVFLVKRLHSELEMKVDVDELNDEINMWIEEGEKEIFG